MANGVHKDLPDSELHVPKGFDGAGSETVPLKNSTNALEYRAVSEFGQQLLFGDGAPSPALGRVNDTYIDKLTGDYHKKTATLVWTFQFNVTASGGITAHNQLSPASLLLDDHPQYFREDGTRAMSGDSDMGGNNITNVGTVDGEDVSQLRIDVNQAQADADSHASRHVEGGADAIANATPATGGLQSAVDKTKLNTIENGATADQTDAEIKTAYENNINTNGFTDAEKSKLAALETSKFLGEFVSLVALQTAFPAPPVGSYGNVDGGVGQDVEKYVWDTDDAKYVLQLGESTILTDAQIKTQYENNADTNAFLDSEKSKLAGIEALAEVNQTDAEIKTQYEANANTNAFTDAEQTKLGGIEAGATQDAASGVTPPAIAATGNAGTDTNTYANANHTHAHGNQAGAALHAAVTPTINGFMTSTDKAKLDEFVHAWLQYSTSIQQDTTGIGGNLILDFADDQNSRPNGIFTKVTVEQFRVDVNCEVEVSFNLDADANANNSGCEAYVTVNNVRQNLTTVRTFLRNNNSESNSLILPPFLLSLSANDIVRFIFNGREAVNVYTIEQNNEGISWAKIKAVRLL